MSAEQPQITQNNEYEKAIIVEFEVRKKFFNGTGEFTPNLLAKRKQIMGLD